ncbi:unnamed protein product [Rhodiola kirilowii]
MVKLTLQNKLPYPEPQVETNMGLPSRRDEVFKDMKLQNHVPILMTIESAATVCSC